MQDLLAGDQPPVRSTLRLLLEHEPDTRNVAKVVTIQPDTPLPARDPLPDDGQTDSLLAVGGALAVGGYCYF